MNKSKGINKRAFVHKYPNYSSKSFKYLRNVIPVVRVELIYVESSQ